MLKYLEDKKIHLFLSVFLAWSLPPAFAQQEEQEAEVQRQAIEELVVTARKKEERLLDIPGSVTALTEDRLRNLGIRSIDDVARFTPGFSFSKAFGRSTERPVIRGAANILAGTTPLAESGASYYLNGVYFQGDIQSLDMNQVERIEVLKGPQSSAYGRNAYAGTVNFVLKDLVGGELDADIKGSLGVAGEGNERNEVAASVRIPVNENFGFMAGIRRWEYGGEYENLTTGTTIGDELTTSINLGAQYTEGAHDIRAYFLNSQDEDGTRALHIQRSDFNNCYPGYRSNLAKTTRVDSVRLGTLSDADRNADNPFQYYCGTVRVNDFVRLNDGNTVDPVPPQGTDLNVHPNSYDATTPFSGVERDRQIYMLQYAFEGNAFNINANLAYREEELRTGSDSDHWDLRFYSAAAGIPPEDANFPQRGAFFTIAGDDVFEDISLEIRFTSDQTKQLRWSAGFFHYDWSRQGQPLDWLYDVNSVTRTTTVRDDPATDGDLARTCGRGVTNDCTTVTEALDVTSLGIGGRVDVDEYTIENQAVFGDLEYSWGRSVLAFELRAAAETKSLRDVRRAAGAVSATPVTPVTTTTEVENGVNVTTTTGVYAQADEGITVSKDAELDFDSLTWKFSYSWNPGDDSLLYASVATGNKPGGLNTFEAEQAGFPDFDEEKSLNYEVGFKSTFVDGRIYMAASLFRNDIEKLQLTSPYSGSVISSAVSNQGDARITGLEYQLRAFPSSYIDVGFSVALTNPEITKGCDPFHYVLTSGGFNLPDPDANGVVIDPAAARPEASCDISGKQIPLTSEVQWSADVNFNYPLHSELGLILTAGINANFESSKYAQVHNGIETGDALEVGFYVGVYGERWSVRLVGRNINDEDAPVAVTRWADYGQGSSCFFNFLGGPRPCANVASSEFTAEQQQYLQQIRLFSFTSGTDAGSPRAPFISLRQGSSWVLTFSYNF